MGERDRGRGWEDLLAEFLAAIFTWAGIGWLVDRWLGTDPWFLIAGAVLGNSLGIYLLWLRSDPERTRAAKDRGTTVGDGS
jgi:ATP synthase protein I